MFKSLAAAAKFYPLYQPLWQVSVYCLEVIFYSFHCGASWMRMNTRLPSLVLVGAAGANDAEVCGGKGRLAH